MAAEDSEDAALPQGFASDLFRKGHFTDFVVECGGYSYRVHKFHLFMQSGYFRATLLSQMQEATSGKVVFTDIDPCLIARFLLFCYDNSIKFESLQAESLPADCQGIVASDKYAGTTTQSFLRAELNVELIALAERFDVRLLKDKVTERFKQTYSSLDASGTAPRALLNRDRCLSLIERIYAKVGDAACKVYVLESLKRQFKRETYMQKRYDHLRQIVNSVPALREQIVEEYMDMVAGPCDDAYSKHLESLEGYYRDQTVRIQENTTVQDVLERYRQGVRSRRYSTAIDGNLYLEYDGQRLGSLMLKDCLGLNANTKLKFGIEE